MKFINFLAATCVLLIAFVRSEEDISQALKGITGDKVQAAKNRISENYFEAMIKLDDLFGNTASKLYHEKERLKYKTINEATDIKNGVKAATGSSTAADAAKSAKATFDALKAKADEAAEPDTSSFLSSLPSKASLQYSSSRNSLSESYHSAMTKLAAMVGDTENSNYHERERIRLKIMNEAAGLGENTKSRFADVKESGKETLDKAKVAVSDTATEVKDKAVDAKDFTAEKANSVSQILSDYQTVIRAKLADLYGGAVEMKDKAADTAQDVKVKAQDASQKASDVAQKASDKASELKEQAQDKAAEVKDKATIYTDEGKAAALNAKVKANSAWQSAKETGHNVKEKLGEFFDAGKEKAKSATGN
jgi:uncharacterized ubiquitin-like protein YukD